MQQWGKTTVDVRVLGETAKYGHEAKAKKRHV